jgi:SAM-dependent methyltransferase
MRPLIRDFVQDVVERLPIADPVVEIGSRPAEGQEEIANIRAMFNGHEFIGCDIQEGTNVDRVEDIHQLTFADDSIGTVITVDTLEHVADPLRALKEIHRVLKPGGVVAISSVMFFPIHAHPWDYWRFTPEGFALLLEPFESSLVMAFGHELLPEGVMGVGVKGPMPDLNQQRFPRTDRWCREWGKGLPIDFGPFRMTYRDLWVRTLRETAKAVRNRARRLKS